MRTRGLLLAFFAASAALRAEEPPDYFENLRDRTFVEIDRSYAIRQKDAPRDSPPLFRARHLLLRVKAGTGDAERRWWPMRTLLLVEAASGNRFVAETTADTGDLGHRNAPKAWTRLSGPRGGAAVETWATSDPGAPEYADTGGTLPEAEGQGACGGTRYRMAGGGLEISSLDLQDVRSRTVSVTIAEIRDAVFGSDEVQELALLRELDTSGLANGSATVANFSPGVRLAWSFLFMDRPPAPRGSPRLVLAPDATPPGDLAPWRRLTYLPQDLPPFPPLPPEGGVK